MKTSVTLVCGVRMLTLKFPTISFGLSLSFDGTVCHNYLFIFSLTSLHFPCLDFHPKLADRSFPRRRGDENAPMEEGENHPRTS